MTTFVLQKREFGVNDYIMVDNMFGVIFPSGKVCVETLGGAVFVYNTFEEFEADHGHHGETILIKARRN